MTHHVEHILAYLTAGTATFLGSKILPTAAGVLAQAGTAVVPEWASAILGPVGALVIGGFAVKWLVGRLDKAEEKADKREEERDADRKTLITVLEQNSAVMRDNNAILTQVKNSIGRNS